MKAIVNDTERDDEMVDRLLEFRAFIDRALPLAFSESSAVPDAAPVTTSATTTTAPLPPITRIIPTSGSGFRSGQASLPTLSTKKVTFKHAAFDAFQTAFRSRRNKPAEMIAKYIDRAMRKGQRDATDEEFVTVLDAGLELYRFTQGAWCFLLIKSVKRIFDLFYLAHIFADKDVFRTFYHRALAKRLLLQRSASDDFEKTVLKKLTTRKFLRSPNPHCFTSKKRILADMMS